MTQIFTYGVLTTSIYTDTDCRIQAKLATVVLSQWCFYHQTVCFEAVLHYGGGVQIRKYKVLGT